MAEIPTAETEAVAAAVVWMDAFEVESPDYKPEALWFRRRRGKQHERERVLLGGKGKREEKRRENGEKSNESWGQAKELSFSVTEGLEARELCTIERNRERRDKLAGSLGSLLLGFSLKSATLS